MSTHLGNAQRIADTLGIERREATMWAGRVEGLKVRVEALSAEPDGGACVVVAIPRPLAVGCLACTGPSVAPLGRTPAIAFHHRRLDTFLVLGAAEPEVARAILCACADDIIALEGANLRITDRTIELSETLLYTPDLLAQQVPKMIALARRLVRERAEWEARHETRIAPIWSELATEARMNWDADRSRITGELYGARVDAQITSDVGVLFARVRSRWPSLHRGLSMAWQTRRPTEVPVRTDPHAWPSDAPMSYEATYATQLIASTGAALSLDDRGAVARLPDVHRADRDHRTPMVRLFRAVTMLTRELLAPPSTRGGVYR